MFPGLCAKAVLSIPKSIWETTWILNLVVNFNMEDKAMTKRFFIAFAIAASLVSCTKESTINNESVSPEGGKLIVKASAPTTKLTFTDNGAGGYSMTFQGASDHLWGYFRNGASLVNYINTSDQEKNRMFMELDEGSLKNGNKTATFNSDCKIIPAEATNIFFYLDNNATPISYNTTPTFCDLHEQSGALADANLLHVIVGSTDIASMTTDSNGDKIANITFEYKTSVIKLDVTFPDGIVPTADENTVLTLTDSDVYNKVHVSWGEPGGSSEKGAITFHPTSVSGQVATAYITVWKGSTFSDATLTGEVDGAVCSVTVNAASPIAAGKVYHMARTLTITDFANVDKWINDDAGEIAYMPGESKDNGPSWITYTPATGKVSWTANTTGSPRKGTLTLSSGKTVTLTQFDKQDFAGTWTFKGDTRTTTTHGAYTKASAAVAKTNTGYGELTGKAKNNYYDDTWTAPGAAAGREISVTIAFDDSQPTNKYSISGIFENLVMPAKISINHAAKEAIFYPFIENTSYLQGSGATYEGEYLGFATELKNKSDGKWQLGFGNGGQFYFSCPVTFTETSTVATFNGSQLCTSYNSYYVVGVLINRYVASGCAGGNMVRSQKSFWAYANVDSGGAAYAQVTQGAFTLTK